MRIQHETQGIGGKAVAAAAAGLLFLTGCTPDTSPSWVPGSTPASNEAPAQPSADAQPIVDIAAAANTGVLSAEVAEAASAVVRVRADVRNAGTKYITGASAVRVEGAYLTAGHALIRNPGEAFEPACGSVKVADARAGSVAVTSMVRASAIYDGVTDLGWLRPERAMQGPAVQLADNPSQPGAVVYAVGYKPKRQSDTTRVPLTQSVPKVIYSGVFAGTARQGDVVIEGIGVSYGGRQETVGGVGNSGGGIIDAAGDLQGVIVSGPKAPVRVSQLEKDLDIRLQKNGKDLSDSTRLTVSYSMRPLPGDITDGPGQRSVSVGNAC